MNAYIVDRSGLMENIRRLKDAAGDTPIYGVIKGNGYGLGLLSMARALKAGGIDRFAVTELSEIQALRENGFESEEILMLRATCLPEELTEILRLHATATVGSPACAEAMETIAADAETVFPCHVKIDVGMGRYGFLPAQQEELRQVYAMPHLNPTGIYTHFPCAFCDDNATKQQFAAFQRVLDFLSSEGIDPKLRHCCNSSAFLKFPQMHLDAVRIGSAFLGRMGFQDGLELAKLGFCRSAVELIREIPKGQTVGYGAAWKARRPTKIAICGVGNFHGFGTDRGNDVFRFQDCLRGVLRYVRACLKKRAYYAEIQGTRARVLGHIGMVQTVLDVTDIPCQIGDPVRFEINPLTVKGMEVVWE